MKVVIKIKYNTLFTETFRLCIAPLNTKEGTWKVSAIDGSIFEIERRRLNHIDPDIITPKSKLLCFKLSLFCKAIDGG